MAKRLVFLYDSTVEPFEDINIQTIQRYLIELQDKGVKCKMVDTKDMPHRDLRDWRREAIITAVWHHQQVRQSFGSKTKSGLPYIGKQVPTLFVYEEGEKIAVAIYPHSKKRRQKPTDFSIEDFLEEFVKAIAEGQN